MRCTGHSLLPKAQRIREKTARRGRAEGARTAKRAADKRTKREKEMEARANELRSTLLDTDWQKPEGRSKVRKAIAELALFGADPKVIRELRGLVDSERDDAPGGDDVNQGTTEVAFVTGGPVELSADELGEPEPATPTVQ